METNEKRVNKKPNTIDNPLHNFWKLKRQYEYNSRQQPEIINDNNEAVNAANTVDEFAKFYSTYFKCKKPFTNNMYSQNNQFF